MNIINEIFRYLDDGKTTLVFPTENSARNALSLYVRERGCSVLATRAMAIDSFAQLFSPKREERPANKYHRLAFVASFLESGNTGLSYLYNDRLYDNRSRFVSFFAKVLTSLSSLKESDFKKGVFFNLYKDLSILRSAYENYLKKNSLFEPSWEKYSIENCKNLEGDFVLVGYDADVQMQRLLNELGNIDNIKTLSLESVEKPTYEQYTTEEAELSMLFDRLLKLKKNNVPVEKIIISSPRVEELSSRLKRKALEYDVPLSFVKSMKLSETLPGRYLFAIRRCINENLSFSSLEALLLNKALAFTNKEANAAFIRFMIDNNHQSGSLSYGIDRLETDLKVKSSNNSSYFSSYNLYKNLKGSLKAISSAKTADSLIKAIHSLTSFLLGNEEFNNQNEEDKDVYSFIFSELGSINKTLKETKSEVNNLFAIFMSEVDKLSYVSQKKDVGIKVYNYGQDYLIKAPYRFIIALNDANAVQRSQDFEFLEDFEISSRKVYDVTENILNYYVDNSETLFISGSISNYSESANAPTYFIKDNLVKECKLPVLEDFIYKADKKSLMYANNTSLAPRLYDCAKDDISLMPVEEKRLSYSSIDNYVKCPYKALLSNAFTYDALEDFEPALQNDRKIGSTLHEIIQLFMQKHIKKLLVKEHLEEYKKEIKTCIDEVLEKSSYDDYTKQSIRSKYYDSLISVLSELFDNVDVGSFMPIVNELSLDQDPSFIGYVDTVIRNVEGDTFLIDYKKGEAKATYQLLIYKRLYENMFEKDEVKDVFFYSMKNKNLVKVKDMASLSAKLDVDIQRTLDGYSSGIWNATPSKEVCAKCEERRICRRRFNLQ